MKQLKYITTAALVAVAIFCSVLYTSCFPKDICKGLKCQNGGACFEQQCVCPTGFEGTYCETRLIDRFLGTYTGTDDCAGAYEVELTTNTNIIRLTMINLNNDGIGTPCEIVGTDSFTFVGVSGSKGYSGSGKFASNTITIRYSYPQGSGTNSCVFIGSK